jgi:RHS repeat-associated protein
MGQIFASVYDELNRPTQSTYPAGLGEDELEKLSTQYDPNGNIQSVHESYSGLTGVRENVKTYDDFDRMHTVTDAFGKLLTYGYDANGNRTFLIDPDGKTTLYAFDEANRLTSVTVSGSSASGGGVTSYSYFNDSRLKRVESPADLQSEYQYDDAGRVATIANRMGTGVVSFFSYEYDANGNRIEQSETNGGDAELTTYRYDDADRLLRVVYPDQTTIYSYDEVGNRTTEVVHAATNGAVTKNWTLGYNSRHQLQSITDNLNTTQSIEYTFDANGNQTSKTQNDLTTHFTFDNRDRVAVIERDLAGGGSELLGRYTYDYQGLRVEKRTESGLIRYAYDDQSVLTQFGIDGLTLAKYEYGPDRLLSLSQPGEGRQFYLFDALGSPVNLVDHEGTLQTRTQYDAWGNVRSEVGESWNPFGFTGHELDDETGLYYAKARFYDPEVGRFLSEDPWSGRPMEIPRVHKYLYAYQNPTVWVDPTGRYDETRGEVERQKRRKGEAAEQAAVQARAEEQWNRFVASQQDLFEADVGRRPEAGDLLVVLKTGHFVYGDGSVVDGSGRIVADHVDFAVLAALATAGQSMAASQAAGATTGQQLTTGAGTLVDELIAEATIIGPNSAVSLGKALTNKRAMTGVVEEGADSGLSVRLGDDVAVDFQSVPNPKGIS